MTKKKLVDKIGLLPVQYIEQHREYTPEEKLSFAILNNALFDYIKYYNSNGNKKFINGARQDRKKAFKSARHWIFSDDFDHIFSFINICYTLHENYKALREKLLTLTPARVKKIEYRLKLLYIEDTKRYQESLEDVVRYA